MVILKVVKTLRNHWKKSVFFVCVASYGGSLLYSRVKINNFMRVYCQEALKVGDQTLDPYAAPRHITVILNPVSKDKRCKYLYEKFVAPIFHCAGLKVSVVQTESETETRGLLGVMSDTDAVVVVGGSGTVHDSITGLLRREDADFVSPSMPIGIIPVSNHPISFSKLFDFKEILENEMKRVSEIKVLAEAAMAVVRENVKSVDVIKIEGKDMGKPVFALNTFDFGILNDLASKVDKYWYYGSRLKPYYPMIKGTLFKNSSSLVLPANISISYTEPCPGCSKCYKKLGTPKSTKVQEVTVSRRWWHSFVPRQLGSQPQSEKKSEPEIDYTKIVNENCGVWRPIPESDLLNVSVHNLINKTKLKLILHSAKDFKKSDLISEGVKLYRKDNFASNIAKYVDAEQIRIEFSNEDNDSRKPSDESNAADENNKTDELPKEKKYKENISKSWFRIDNEHYEAQNVEISLMPQKIRVYC